MKFNRGPTRQEKWLAAKSLVCFYKAGFRKFAWLPVRVGSNDCRWLEYVWCSYPEAYRVFGRAFEHCPNLYPHPVNLGKPVYKSLT